MDTDLSQRDEMINGVLQAAGFETRFRRAGVGVPVVVISRDGGEAHLQEVLELLARYSRVLLVQVPAEVPRYGESGLQAWLQGVIDGFGVSGPVLIIESELAELVLRFARNDPARVGGVIIVDPRSAADEDLDQGIVALLRASAGGGG